LIHPPEPLKKNTGHNLRISKEFLEIESVILLVFPSRFILRKQKISKLLILMESLILMLFFVLKDMTTKPK